MPHGSTARSRRRKGMPMPATAPAPPRVTRPRDAATLVLVRRDGPAPRVLMGRRSAGHDFMPGKWVFPGGRIDRADWRMRAAAGLPPETEAALAATRRLARQDPAGLARALAMAAVRETFEEAGLLLARPAPWPVPAPGPFAAFAALGLAPDLSGLRYLARAITPPARHRRFDARFLLAEADGLVDLRPTDSRELADVAWLTLDEARRLDLPTVTRAVIELLGAHFGGHAPADPPFWRWSRAGSRSAL